MAGEVSTLRERCPSPGRAGHLAFNSVGLSGRGDAGAYSAPRRKCATPAPLEEETPRMAIGYRLVTAPGAITSGHLPEMWQERERERR